MNQYESGGDDQSEDGQLRSGDEMSNEEDDVDTADSLDIKPPQPHRNEVRAYRPKKTSKEKKHSRDRRHRDRLNDNQGPPPQHNQQRSHDRNDRRHKHRMDRTGGGRRFPGEGPPQGNFNRGGHNNMKSDMMRYDQYRGEREHYRVGGSGGHMQEPRDMRDREKDNRNHREQQQQRRRGGGASVVDNSPEKSDGDKILEDLRSRLLIKKRKYETEGVPRADDKSVSSGEYESKRAEKKIARLENEQVPSSKRERVEGERKEHHHKTKRDRERKQPVEVVDSPEHDVPHKTHKDRHHQRPPPQTAEEKEHASRREKLLEAEREMARRKELAREELEARREMRREREEVRPEDGSVSPQPETKKKKSRHITDEEVLLAAHPSKKKRSDEVTMVSDKSEEEDEQEDDENDTETDSSSSSLSDEDDDEEDVEEEEEEEEDEEHRDEKKDESDVDMTSPLSVGELTKSDLKKKRKSSRSRSQSRDTKSHSRSTSRSKSRTPRSQSRSHSRSRSRSRSLRRSHTRSPRNRSKSGTPENIIDAKETKKEESKKIVEEVKVEEKDVLPPYYPGIQGCRSVEEFQCLNRIEEGTYGVVYRAKDKRTETIVALKKLKMEKEKEGFPITSLREINTLLKGQHPNIVTVREIVVGSNMDKIFIVMDYVEHDLKSLMETMKHKKQVFLPGEVKCLTQQLLSAVAHLHDNWILHRDLKTSNLLLSHKGILKVGDFGLAREYGSPLKAYTSIVVTLWYRAPELLLCSKEYSTPIDIWSVGCIFAEFLAMTALFPGKSEVDQLNRIFKDLGTPNERIWPGYGELPAVQRMTFTEYPVSNLRRKFSHLTSELGLSLLQGLLTYDPKQRFTAEIALKNNYFKELPLPIDPAMFPTWPAKSELGSWKPTASPKPPSGGSEFKQLGADDGDQRWGAMMESRQLAMGPGFSLKF